MATKSKLSGQWRLSGHGSPISGRCACFRVLAPVGGEAVPPPGRFDF
jgi:hypothetical protein